jgi:hypothetical protein
LTLLLLIRGHYPVPYAWPRVVLALFLALGLYLAWEALPVLQAWYLETLLVTAFLLLAARLLDVSPASMKDAS